MNLPIDNFSIIIILFLLVALCSQILSYFTTAKKLKIAEQENLKLRRNMEEESLRLLENARTQALRIITEAQQKAQSILSETANFQKQSTSTLQKTMQTVQNEQIEALRQSSRALLATYENSLDKLKEEDIKVFKNISKAIETDVQTELHNFKKALEKQTIDSQRLVEEKIEQEYRKAQLEIEQYKTQQLQRINEALYPLLKNVVEKAIGNALTYDQQQNLVIKALEDAKKRKEIIL